MSLVAEVAVRRGPLDLRASLEVATGEVVALLGPNGAGKTTLLRVLAGLLSPAAGRVVLDGQVLDDPAAGVRVPPERRPVGVVFQDYLLFPHLSVLDNVAFGLRSRGMHRRDARRAAQAWLDRVGLGAEGRRRPGELSGGQAQRVALARALATSPRLLLLDEPLSALDVGTRARLRRDLRLHLEEFAGTRLLVTHDPLEAMVLAARLVILEDGRVVQSGSPAEVSSRPRSRYVAQLVGLNLFQGRARRDHVELEGGGALVVPEAGEGEVYAVVRPQAVALHRAAPGGTPRNVWPGTVESTDVEGERVRVRVAGPVPVVAEVTLAAATELRLAEGGPVWLSIKATEVDVYPA